MNYLLKKLKTEFKWQKFIYTIYSKKIEIDENSFEKELNQLIQNKKLLLNLNYQK